MVFAGKLIASVLANIVLYALGLFSLIATENLFVGSLIFSMFATIAFFVSDYLDGRPNITTRAIVACILICLTGRVIHAVIAPFMILILWFIVTSILAGMNRN